MSIFLNGIEGREKERLERKQSVEKASLQSNT